jgi:hypothetical protein
MEYWSNGVLEYWSNGVLEYWEIRFKKGFSLFVSFLSQYSITL